jgi:hypothetical protein
MTPLLLAAAAIASPLGFGVQLAEDTVVVAAPDGTVAAYDLGHGKQAWTSKDGMLPVATADGLVLVVGDRTDEGFPVNALSVDQGDLRWKCGHLQVPGGMQIRDGMGAELRFRAFAQHGAFYLWWEQTTQPMGGVERPTEEMVSTHIVAKEALRCAVGEEGLPRLVSLDVLLMPKREKLPPILEDEVRESFNSFMGDKERNIRRVDGRIQSIVAPVETSIIRLHNAKGEVTKSVELVNGQPKPKDAQGARWRGFSTDGQHAYVASQTEAQLYAVPSGTRLCQVDAFGYGRPWTVTGQRVVGFDANQQLTAWNAKTGEVVWQQAVLNPRYQGSYPPSSRPSQPN